MTENKLCIIAQFWMTYLYSFIGKGSELCIIDPSQWNGPSNHERSYKMLRLVGSYSWIRSLTNKNFTPQILNNRFSKISMEKEKNGNVRVQVKYKKLKIIILQTIF